MQNANHCEQDAAPVVLPPSSRSLLATSAATTPPFREALRTCLHDDGPLQVIHSCDHELNESPSLVAKLRTVVKVISEAS